MVVRKVLVSHDRRIKSREGTAVSVPFPHHPEPMVMRWSGLEIACITQYAAAVRKDERERCGGEASYVRLTEPELGEIAVQEQFLLFCDQAEFNDIARHIEQVVLWRMAALKPKEST